MKFKLLGIEWNFWPMFMFVYYLWPFLHFPLLKQPEGAPDWFHMVYWTSMIIYVATFKSVNDKLDRIMMDKYEKRKDKHYE